MRTYATFGGVRNWVFVRVETAEGLYGWGEASMELWHGTMRAAIEELGARLVGMDALASERVWQVATRHGFWRGGAVLASAVAAIDQALWDIRGKFFQTPVYRLLGGPTREWVETYRHAGIYDPDDLQADARALVDRGVRTIKTGAWVSDSVLTETERLRRVRSRMEGIRAAVGDDVDILVDYHGRATPDEAIRLIQAIAEFRPRWVEEPIAPESPELIADVTAEAHRHGISIALGERLFSRWDFRTVLERQLIDVAQPDLCHAGGITETMKIASLADLYRVQMAPHNPAGPVSTAAAAHVAMAISNFSILEQCIDEPRWSQIVAEPWSREGSRLLVPDLPGLGVDLDVNALKAVPPAEMVVPSAAFRADGSVADV
ncbi:galactonate dehydratase [Brooklawnia cerclae]|uniref:Galactonate dehydratase n=1 Tax=Brooklawnia cerclae TaxID=349934 RepID=A0ABX0SAJ2_9ACTN|nr:galactonate dehydratase [Brooklawnia cerclae]